MLHNQTHIPTKTETIRSKIIIIIKRNHQQEKARENTIR